jgi:hypothetical protein
VRVVDFECSYGLYSRKIEFMDETPPPTRLRQLAAQLAEPKPMRRGSLSERSWGGGMRWVVPGWQVSRLMKDDATSLPFVDENGAWG